MNILVTGANGQLGISMRNCAKNAKSNKYVFTDISDIPGYDTIKLDIRDSNAVIAACKAYDIDIIVNCAAYTNVDGAENPDNYELCQELNTLAPKILAEAMKLRNGILVHVSTDYVFGKEPYNMPCGEDQKGTPTGVYGATKLAGEIAIRTTGCKHLIFRTAWLYSEYGKNFMKTMIKLIGSKPSINVVIDQAGTPTYAGDLAACIFDVIENRKYENNYGTYNYSNEGVCSWFDFSIAIKKLMENGECVINPCRSEEFPSPVKRPAYSVLDKTKVKNAFHSAVPYWTDSLKKCYNNYMEMEFKRQVHEAFGKINHINND